MPTNAATTETTLPATHHRQAAGDRGASPAARPGPAPRQAPPRAPPRRPERPWLADARTVTGYAGRAVAAAADAALAAAFAWAAWNALQAAAGLSACWAALADAWFAAGAGPAPDAVAKVAAFLGQAGVPADLLRLPACAVLAAIGFLLAVSAAEGLASFARRATAVARRPGEPRA